MDSHMVTFATDTPRRWLKAPAIRVYGRASPASEHGLAMPQTRPLPSPEIPVAPASPGTLPKTDEPSPRCPPGRCARLETASIADVVAQCAAREVRTPTQYVARWTEVAVVARERGHLAGQAELSFDRAADVDAARPVLEDAVCGAIAAEEGCGEEPARERTRELVGALDRPKARRGSGGKGKRREAAPARRLSEIRDREIPHELRWNRCAELAASLELTAIEAGLLAVVSMFSVTSAFVCWETRAGLMGMARIKTKRVVRGGGGGAHAARAAGAGGRGAAHRVVPGRVVLGRAAGRRGARHAGGEAGARPAPRGGTAGGSAPGRTARLRSRRRRGRRRRRRRG